MRLKPRPDVVVRHVACTQWEIGLRLNDRKMSMDKNAKSGLTGEVILPDVVWHVFSAASGGYNKVRRGDGEVGVHTPTPSSESGLLQTSVREIFQINIHGLNWCKTTI